MSVIVSVCDDPCPLHIGYACTKDRGHAMPHRATLTTRKGGRAVDCIAIEWRPAIEELSAGHQEKP